LAKFVVFQQLIAYLSCQIWKPLPKTMDNPSFIKELSHTISENYGQSVIYKGTIPHHERFKLDKQYLFAKDEAFPVCGNTYRMLHDTRFAPHFEFMGSWETHYGIFKEAETPFDEKQNDSETTSGCCC
jgi:hypothetical protein